MELPKKNLKQPYTWDSWANLFCITLHACMIHLSSEMMYKKKLLLGRILQRNWVVVIFWALPAAAATGFPPLIEYRIFSCQAKPVAALGIALFLRLLLSLPVSMCLACS